MVVGANVYNDFFLFFYAEQVFSFFSFAITNLGVTAVGAHVYNDFFCKYTFFFFSKADNFFLSQVQTLGLWLLGPMFIMIYIYIYFFKQSG